MHRVTETVLLPVDSNTSNNSSPNSNQMVPEKSVEEKEEHLKVEVDEATNNGPPSSSESSASSIYDEVSNIQASPSTSLDENTVKKEEEGVKDSRKRRQKKPLEVERARKSVRINKIPEKEAAIVSNYTGIKDVYKSRGVQYPKGVVRVPFQTPEKPVKENGKLRIDMNCTRERPILTESPIKKSKNTTGQIMEGKEYQAILPDCHPIEMAKDLEDRDELVWSPELVSNTNLVEFRRVYETCQPQYGTTIPMDAYLHRYMKSGYNIDKMLETLEVERDNLPQPFRPFTVAQQTEFEKHIRRPTGYIKSKAFKYMQDRFLRSYHLGEIVNYYYLTKRHHCTDRIIGRCSCREVRRYMKEPENVVDRIECANCTSNLRESVKNTNKYCRVCALYFKRNGRHRVSPGRLTDDEENLIKIWNEMEKSMKRVVTLDEVHKKMEADWIKELENRPLTQEEIISLGSGKKRDKSSIALLLAPFRPKQSNTCTKKTDKIDYNSNRCIDLKNDDLVPKLIEAFQQFGKDFEKISEATNIDKMLVKIFFNKFETQLSAKPVVQSAVSHQNYTNNNNNGQQSTNGTRQGTRIRRPVEKIGAEKKKEPVNNKKGGEIRQQDGPAASVKRRSRGV